MAGAAEAADSQLVMGTGPGTSSGVRLVTLLDDRSLQPYDPVFRGGVNVALGDIDGDGIADVITGTGQGGQPHIRVFSGTDLHPLASFLAYDAGFFGGVSVAAGDINGDGRADIITGAGPGGTAHIKVFSGIDLHVLASFTAYASGFRGGVHVAAGDVNGDGRADIVAGAGPGGGPHVQVFSGVDLSVLASFFAYDPAFLGGVNVAAGDLDGDGRSDLITGAGPGGAPHVLAFSGADLHVLTSFFAYDPAFHGGVRVAAGDLDEDGRVDLITGAGAGGPHVRAFSGIDFHLLGDVFAFEAGSGVSIGSTGDAGVAAGTSVRFSSALSTSFDAGIPGTFTVRAIGIPTPALTSAGTLPSGVTFVDNGDGTATLSGTPATGTGGSYQLTFTAANGVGAPATQSFTLTVRQAPAITSASSATFRTATAGAFTVTTTGYPRPALAYTGATLPAGVTFVDRHDGTALLSGTPALGSAGDFVIQVSAANGIGAAAAQTFTLSVRDLPTLPSSGSPLVMGAGQGSSPLVRVVGGTEDRTVEAYPASFLGGVEVALADINGDGTPDIITGAGPGGLPQVRVFSGTDLHDTATAALNDIASFMAFAPGFGGGVHVAAGDIDGDGRADIIVGAGAGGGPQVRVFSGVDLHEILSFFAYDPSFAGGVRVASGDVNGDGRADIIVGAGAGGGPHVQVISGADRSVLASFFAYDPSFSGGVNVAAGDLDGDGKSDVITGAGPGGGPHVQVFSGADLHVLASFFAFDPAYAGGVNVAIGDIDGDTVNDVIASTGGGAPWVRVFSGADGQMVGNFLAFAGSSGGASIGALSDQGLRFTSSLSTTFQVSTPGTFTITALGSPTPALSSSGALPSGVTFTDNGDGTATLAGTPAAGTGAAYPLTFTADNGVATPATQSFTLNVQQPPAITSAASTTFPIGASSSFSVTTTGFPRPTLTRGGVALPAGITWVDNGDGTGTLAGTAGAATGGTYALTFTADNGVGGSVVQNFTLTVNQAPVFTSLPTATFTLNTPGTTFQVVTTGSPAPTVSVTAGVLPTGLTLSPGGLLSGTPTQSGSFPVTLTATNGILPNATQAFTVLVNAAPAITSAAATTFTVGSAGSFNVVMTGFPAPTVSVTAGTLPSGITLTSAGLLSGTPATATGGTYNVTLTATNGIGANAVQAFTLTINDPPIITSANTATFTLNTAGTTFQVVMTGTPAPTVSVTAGVLPTGLTLSSAGLLSGTPTQSGSFPVTLTATNGTLPNATQAFTVLVNAAPAITSAAATTFTVGSAGSFNVVMTGFPAPTVSVTAGTLPAGVTLTSAGLLSGTPATGTGGTYNVTFTATNGIGADAVQAFTLTINEPPIITSVNTATFPLNIAGTTFQVVMTGIPAPTVSVTSGVLPTGLTLSTAGLLSGTATQSGSFPVTLTATNGTLPNATQAFTVVVTAAPAITSAAATTFTVGSAGSFTVVMTGSPTPTVSVTAGTLPAGVTLSPAGILSGTPDPGTGGVYNVTFTATNGIGANAVQAFTLTVNQAPAITSANTATFLVNTAGTTFQVVMTGFPAPTVSVTAGVLPTGLTLSTAGLLSGTPTQSGSFPVTLTATNGTLPNATQSFTVAVNAPPAITSANSTTFTVGTPGSFTVTTTGFPVPTVSESGALPTGVTFTPATKVLGGTATQTGAFPLVFDATNSVPPDATQNFTLNVVCPAITVNPSTLPDGLFTTAYGPLTFTQTGSTGSSFTWSATGLPTGIGIAPTTGVVSGSPTTTVVSGAVAITVTDNFGCTGTRNTTITIRPVAGADTFGNGVGNTQLAVGAIGVGITPSTPFAALSGDVKTNDNGPGALSVALAAATTNGGTIVEGGADGSFLYTPPANFAGSSDSFTYTLTDGNGVTNTATVTINLLNRVWYVNGAAAVNGDGRSHSPFNDLNNAQTPSLAGDIVYVHTGGATTAGSLALDANTTLQGAGGALTLNGGALSIPAGTPPTLTGTVTLADNTAIRNVSFNSAAPAITASNLATTQAILIDGVSVTGGTNALSLTNVTGASTLTVSNSSFTNTTGAEVLVSGGTMPLSIGATISSNAGEVINIQGRTSGAVTFSGAVTGNGGTGGIILNSNGTSTFTFSGGVSLNGANSTFTATSSGTLNITGTNTIGATTPPTSTALNVANTNIGASGLTFRSISAGTGSGSAGVGISLNSTGLAAGNGGLTVTGNSTAGSGGTIQHKTGADGSLTDGIGIVLQNTKNASFNWMQLNDFDNSAITGRNVNGFTLTNSVINGTIGTTNVGPEGAINFGVSNPGGSNGLQGTGLIRNTKVSGAVEHNLEFYNQSGTMDLTIDGVSAAGPTGDCRITSNSAALGSDGVQIEMQGSAAATVTVQRCYFDDNKSQAVQAAANDDSSIAITIDSSRIVRTTQGNEGFILSNGSNGDLTAMVSNNNISGLGGTAIFVGQTAGNATSSSQLHASVLNNVINQPTTATNHGIIAFLTSTVGQVSQARIRIDGNTVTNNSTSGTTRGILVDTPDANTTPNFHATVTNNSVAVGDNIAGVGGLVVQARQTAGTTGTAHIAGNTVTFPNGNPGVNGLRARQVTATFNLEQSASCTGTATAVLACQNPGASTETLGTIGVVAAGSTLLPNVP